ncbi:YbaB/EbfC family nucleoid-associated protein [Cellulomonas bogoriensis]|uniref:YbaB/EbfC DNA-binding family protein n=1 Tax=Cellulomonas bogoriensis 69B4 = DSM 16987 TaxID=1386082 RepID=A0A0A0BWI6_9CELL|nr:YbaB/EbfC family nucleoid-associated protein [Cellulomonas bogoriensis]KGM12330.1 hypothetical protein N869_16980 [Cellulomonas bogoriensis 69B4 = DSM 16987]
MVQDPETQRWVAQMEAAALERLEAAAALQNDLATTTGVGSSADRGTTVTVNASGVLVDVEFTARALDLSPDQLRAAVLEAAAHAQTDAATRVATLTEGLPGAQDMRDLIAGRVPERTQEDLARELAARRGEPR